MRYLLTALVNATVAESLALGEVTTFRNLLDSRSRAPYFNRLSVPRRTKCLERRQTYQPLVRLSRGVCGHVRDRTQLLLIEQCQTHKFWSVTATVAEFSVKCMTNVCGRNRARAHLSGNLAAAA